MAHYTQLTLEQRYLIQTLTHQKHQQKDTAKQVGVNPSTISRELARYGQTYPNQPYQAVTAQQLSKATAKRKPYKLQGHSKKKSLKASDNSFPLSKSVGSSPWKQATRGLVTKPFIAIYIDSKNW